MVADTGGRGFSLLRVDGGASQNGLLMQLQADAIQVFVSSASNGSCASFPNIPDSLAHQYSSLTCRHAGLPLQAQEPNGCSRLSCLLFSRS